MNEFLCTFFSAIFVAIIVGLCFIIPKIYAWIKFLIKWYITDKKF